MKRKGPLRFLKKKIIKETDNMRMLVMLAKNFKEKSVEEGQHAIFGHASDLSLDLIGEEQHVEEEDTVKLYVGVLG
jgi:hypothetical protein